MADAFSGTYADPAIIRGKDGFWYMYATSDPLHEGNSLFGLMHIARTPPADSLITWDVAGFALYAIEFIDHWVTAG